MKLISTLIDLFDNFSFHYYTPIRSLYVKQNSEFILTNYAIKFLIIVLHNTNGVLITIIDKCLDGVTLETRKDYLTIIQSSIDL